MIGFPHCVGSALVFATVLCITTLSAAQEYQPGTGFVVFHVDSGCHAPGHVSLVIETKDQQWKRFGYVTYNHNFYSTREPFPVVAALPTGIFGIYGLTCGSIGSRYMRNYGSKTAFARFEATEGKVINAGTLKIIVVPDPNATFLSLSKEKFDVAVGPMPKDVLEILKKQRPEIARGMITRQMIGRSRPQAAEKK